MEQMNEEIKKEFNEKIKTIEELDENKNKMINVICYVTSIILFVSVLVSTVISINNYFNAKNKQEDNIPVVTLKKN